MGADLMKRSLLSPTVLGFALSARLLVFAAPAQAQDEAPQPSPTLDEARTAFIEGRDLMEEQEWAKAAAQFSFAVRVRNTPGLRYYVGYCQEQDGLLLEALDSYREAERLLEILPAADVEKLIPEAVERIRAVLPQLILRNVPSGATLRVDGESRHLSQQFALNPGKHTVLLIKKGYVSLYTDVDLEPGKRSVLEIEMEPLESTPESGAGDPSVASDPEADRGSSPLRTGVFWGSTSVAVVGLGTGIVGTLLFANAGKDLNSAGKEVDELGGLDSSCENPAADVADSCSDLESAGKRRNFSGNLMVGGYAAAGVGVVGALLTHFLWEQDAISVNASASPRGSWVSVRGSF